jgi:hypothetical protein
MLIKTLLQSCGTCDIDAGIVLPRRSEVGSAV